MPNPRMHMFSLSQIAFLMVSFFLIHSLKAQIHDETPIELSGYSVSESYDIEDDRPIDLNAPPIERLLYRIKSSSPRTRTEYSRYSQDVSWDDVLNKTDEFRLWTFDRSAQVKKIERHKIVSADPDSAIQEFFVCHCKLSPQNPEDPIRPLIVLTRTLPQLLPIGVSIDEPVRFHGFLLQRNPSPNGETVPVFVADRLAWYPKASHPDRASRSHVALAAAGVDIGQLDFVKENNAKRLSSRDSEAFFQMIAGVAQMRPLDDDIPRITFSNLLKNTEHEFGNAVRVRGFVRTCTAIRIEDKDIQDRIGVSKYYQLIIFPGKKVIIKHKDGSETDYEQFPITVVCTQLPEGMTPEDLEKSQVQIDGFFFRLWTFRSDKSDQEMTSSQPSPLLITKRPIEIASDPAFLNSVLTWFVFVMIVGVLILVVTFRIADRRKKYQATSLVDQLPETIEVTGIDV